MEPETLPSAPTTLVGDAPSSSPPDGSTPSVLPAAAPSQPPATDAPSVPITDDLIEAHLSKLTHDDLKRFPAYNDRLSAGLQQAQRKLRQEAEAQQARQAQYAQSDAFFKQYESDPASFGQLMIAHPEYAATYQEVQKWRKTGGVPPVDAAAITDRLVQNVEDHYRADQRFAHMTDEHWRELRAEGKTADDFFFGLIEAGIADERKRLIAAHKAELDAREKAWQAKYAGAAEEPGTVPGTPTGGNGTYTLEQINRMSRVEREALPAGVEQAALHAAMGIR